jgi:hypothetical protein
LIRAENQTLAPLVTKSEKKFPSPLEFMLDLPLYHRVVWDASNVQEVRTGVLQLQQYNRPLDAFCVWCKKQTSFLAEPTYRSPDHSGLETGLYARQFTINFKCPHDSSHRLTFIFNVGDSAITKIGQYPSISDLIEPIVREYRAVLSAEKYRELTRGIGLASHGVGIGAFVYLRRIFEDLVREAHEEAAQYVDWDEDAYRSARMDDKIGLLKGYLPEYLFEIRKAYSILSKGIHGLTEEECLEYFPVLQLGIELILDQKLEQKRRTEKMGAATKAINKILEKLS